MAKDDRMSTKAFTKAHTKGIHVDILKYPAWYTPPRLDSISTSAAGPTGSHHLQTTHSTPRDQALKPANDGVRQRGYPDELPVAPLHDAGPSSNDQVNGAEEEEGP